MTEIVGYIQRFATSDQGTPGQLIFPFGVYFVLELPWRGNIPLYSCIPPGKYPVRWTRSPRLKRFTYEVLQVQRRAGIRFHSGNFAGASDKGFKTHSLGCPLPGRSFSSRPQLMVNRSRDAMLEIESKLAGRPWILEVGNELVGKSI